MKPGPALQAFVNGMPERGSVVWAVIHGRATQHAVVVAPESLMAWFECMNRGVKIEGLDLRTQPFSLEDAVLCKRYWCRDHFDDQTTISDPDRVRMRKALLKIEKELVEPEALS